MKYPILSLVFFTLLCAGCVIKNHVRSNMGQITKVIYTSETGPILPELQWHEETTISDAKVIFSRSGQLADTQVNTGTWEIAMEEEITSKLFSQIQNVDCKIMTRIEPADPPDGGGIKTYTISYTDGENCSLMFDPGTTYTNGEMIVKPVQEFLKAVPFPTDALNQYK